MKKTGFTLIELLVCIAVVSICIWAGFMWGSIYGSNKVRKEAVKAKVAHYESGKDGSSKFTWDKPRDKKQ